VARHDWESAWIKLKAFHNVRAGRRSSMPRHLKTYQTSIGFFDLAIAAPSMKAALEAWGSKANLFHQGFAKEATDPAVIAAAMAKPGVVLRRAVGTDRSFSEDAEFSSDLPVGDVNLTRRARVPKSAAAPPTPKRDANAERAAAMAHAREQNRRDSERRRQQAAQEAERKRRGMAIAKAQAALEEAERTHEAKIEEIATARAALERRSEAEETRWDQQRAKLQEALDRACE
jgi:hypothetical protein